MESLKFIFISILLVILTQWISVFPHEFAHSTMAWFLGYKADPMNIYYGHFNWQNVIFVSGIDENVNYDLMRSDGAYYAIAWTGLAGPFVTLILYLLSLIFLTTEKFKIYKYIFYFVFLLNLINLSELVSYLVLRSFSSHGDMAHIEFGWNISPWFIFIIGGALCALGVWYLFSRLLNKLYKVLDLEFFSRIFILSLSSFYIFGQGGIRMFIDPYGFFATTLAILFLILMPIMIFLYWPRRN